MLISNSERASTDVKLNLPIGFEKGQVFTPRFLASWVADLLNENLGSLWSGNLLDPACGDGELLEAALEQMPNAKLFGTDIDSEASDAAQVRLGHLADIKTADMLLMRSLESSQNLPKVDAIVANPPWGADLFHSASDLKGLGYSLANGQFDSWSLFVEMSLRILEVDGIAIFILPDSIFSPEHKESRKLIAGGYSIELIARLGEGIFKGVHRGTTVLVIRKRKPSALHSVEVFRLAKSQRAKVLASDITLQEARKLGSHHVSQRRFMADKKCRWDIDVRNSDQGLLEKLESFGGNWTDLLVSGRGVELSKRGLVKVCGTCGFALPSPIRPRVVICGGCGGVFNSEEMLIQRLVEPKGTKLQQFMPFVVGEDIGRYELSCSRQIKLDVPGINYKDREIYSRERLLVRKTGVGLKATVTKRATVSNQVVFHYTPKFKGQSFLLHYVLGVLSSRILFAYHLRKSGENEWRSHPYVTPKTLKELPIPAPKAGSQTWRQAEAIANCVKEHLRSGGKSEKLDLKIEGLVAGLYRLDRSDIVWVKKVICDAQSLEPMRTLGEFNCDSVEIDLVP